MFTLVLPQVFQACGSPRGGVTSTTAQEEVSKGGKIIVEDRVGPSTGKLEQMVSALNRRAFRRKLNGLALSS